MHDTNPGRSSASNWSSPAVGDVTAGALERLDFALRAGRPGYWEFYPETQQLISPGAYRENCGREATEEFTYEQLLASIHPDDRAAHELSVQKAVEEGSDLDIEYRVPWPDEFHPEGVECSSTTILGGAE